MIDAEVVDHHIYREHPHDQLCADNGDVLQMDLRIVKDDEQQHEQESGGDDHDEVMFEQGIQFSPEKFAEDKQQHHRYGHRKIHLSRQIGQDGLVSVQSRHRPDDKHRCDERRTVIDCFPEADDLRRQSVKDEDENQAKEHLHDCDRKDDAGDHYMERDQPHSVWISLLRFHPTDVREQERGEHETEEADQQDTNDFGSVPFLILQQQKNAAEDKPGKNTGKICIVAAHIGPIDLHIAYPHSFGTSIRARHQRIYLQFHYISLRRHNKKRPIFYTRP